MPYDNEAYNLIKYKNPKYEICGLISPKGWGLNKKDSGVTAGDKANGLIVNKVSIDFESVIIVESSIFISVKEYIIPKLKELDLRNKDLVILRSLSEDEKQLIMDFSKEYDAQVTFVNENTVEIQEATELYQFATPIVFVTGLMEGIGKFDVQLKLREDMGNKDLKISQIGTKSYSEFYGFNGFPEFMFDETLSSKRKIMMFNRYVKALEMEEQPDVIIIGVPGGFMPINNKMVENFGELNFLVSNAIRPDSVCVVLPNSQYDREGFKELSNMARFSYNYVVDAFVISNVLFDYSVAEQSNEKSLTIIKHDAFQEFLGDLDVDRNCKVDIHGNSEVSVCEWIVRALSDEAVREII